MVKDTISGRILSSLGINRNDRNTEAPDTTQPVQLDEVPVAPRVSPARATLEALYSNNELANAGSGSAEGVVYNPPVPGVIIVHDDPYTQYAPNSNRNIYGGESARHGQPLSDEVLRAIVRGNQSLHSVQPTPSAANWEKIMQLKYKLNAAERELLQVEEKLELQRRTTQTWLEEQAQLREKIAAQKAELAELEERPVTPNSDNTERQITIGEL